MAYQSLYRRFRPQRFSEVIGQDHLVRALRNAIVEDRVGHAYLLSGPRGTGKTSTARILAKALNCDRLGEDGEPCGECDRCTSIETGSSLELIEMDAASHNSVNDIRELTATAALGGTGRRKVYLLDEVHMLSTAASNALLKTLEEPPAHVVFILATTDPQKVLPTIRSRTQHIELSLVGAKELAEHLQRVAALADIELTDDMVSYLLEQGAGSVRDALSALDQIVTAGGIPSDRTDADQLVSALAATDLAAALGAVANAVAAGADPRDLAERTARRLRDMFLAANGVGLDQLPPEQAAASRALAEQMGVRSVVRALELLGVALAQMPQTADRRLTLEAAVVQLLADAGLNPEPPVGNGGGSGTGNGGKGNGGTGNGGKGNGGTGNGGTDSGGKGVAEKPPAEPSAPAQTEKTQTSQVQADQAQTGQAEAAQAEAVQAEAAQASQPSTTQPQAQGAVQPSAQSDAPPASVEQAPAEQTPTEQSPSDLGPVRAAAAHSATATETILPAEKQAAKEGLASARAALNKGATSAPTANADATNTVATDTTATGTDATATVAVGATATGTDATATVAVGAAATGTDATAAGTTSEGVTSEGATSEGTASTSTAGKEELTTVAITDRWAEVLEAMKPPRTRGYFHGAVVDAVVNADGANAAGAVVTLQLANGVPVPGATELLPNAAKAMTEIFGQELTAQLAAEQQAPAQQETALQEATQSAAPAAESFVQAGAGSGAETTSQADLTSAIGVAATTAAGSAVTGSAATELGTTETGGAGSGNAGIAAAALAGSDSAGIAATTLAGSDSAGIAATTLADSAAANSKPPSPAASPAPTNPTAASPASSGSASISAATNSHMVFSNIAKGTSALEQQTIRMILDTFPGARLVQE